MNPGESRIDIEKDFDQQPITVWGGRDRDAVISWGKYIAERVEEQTIQRMCGDGDKPFPRLYSSAPGEKKG